MGNCSTFFLMNLVNRRSFPKHTQKEWKSKLYNHCVHPINVTFCLKKIWIFVVFVVVDLNAMKCWKKTYRPIRCFVSARRTFHIHNGLFSKYFQQGIVHICIGAEWHLCANVPQTPLTDDFNLNRRLIHLDEIAAANNQSDSKTTSRYFSSDKISIGWVCIFDIANNAIDLKCHGHVIDFFFVFLSDFFCSRQVHTTGDYNEPYGRKRMDEMSIQRTTCGAIPADAVSFGQVQGQVQRTTARYVPVQCHTSRAERNIGTAFQRMCCILPCQSWKYRTKQHVTQPVNPTTTPPSRIHFRKHSLFIVIMIFIVD